MIVYTIFRQHVRGKARLKHESRFTRRSASEFNLIYISDLASVVFFSFFFFGLYLPFLFIFLFSTHLSTRRGTNKHDTVTCTSQKPQKSTPTHQHTHTLQNARCFDYSIVISLGTYKLALLFIRIIMKWCIIC